MLPGKLNVTLLGNDLVANSYITGNSNTITGQLQALLGGRYASATVHTVGSAGATTQDLLSLATTAGTTFDPTATNIMLIWEISNSICAQGRTAAQAAADTQALIPAILAVYAGWQILIVSAPPRQATTLVTGEDAVAALNATLASANALIGQNCTSWGAVGFVDVRSTGSPFRYAAFDSASFAYDDQLWNEPAGSRAKLSPTGLGRVATQMFLAICNVQVTPGSSKIVFPFFAAPGSFPGLSSLLFDYRAENVTGQADNAALASITDPISGHVATTYRGSPRWRSSAAFGHPTWQFDAQSAFDIGLPANLVAAAAGGDFTMATVYLIPAVGAGANAGAGPAGQDTTACFYANGKYGPANNQIGCGSGASSQFGADFVAGTLMVHVQTATSQVGQARGYFNGNAAGGESGDILHGGASLTSAHFGIGTSNLANGDCYFQGHVIAHTAWNRSLTYPEIIMFTRYWFNRLGLAAPWASRARYNIYFNNSIYCYNGSTAVSHPFNTIPFFAERAMGRNYGQFCNMSRGGISTVGLLEIANRELPSLSAALGIPVTVVWGQFRNGGEATQQASISRIKQIDPTFKIVMVTSTDSGSPNPPFNSYGLSSGPYDTDGTWEAGRKAYDDAWYNPSDPNGLVAGWQDTDFVIPTHLNPHMGVPGAAWAADNYKYYTDFTHPLANDQPDHGCYQIGAVSIAPMMIAHDLDA